MFDIHSQSSLIEREVFLSIFVCTTFSVFHF